MEWLKVNAPIGSLTENNLEHCAVALYEELARGHTVVGEANNSQQQLPAGNQQQRDMPRGREGLERKGGGGVGQLGNRIATHKSSC